MKTRNHLILMLSTSLLWGCFAFEGNPWATVNFHGPPPTTVTIMDAKGSVVGQGQTPYHVVLDHGEGELNAAKYSILFETPRRKDRLTTVNVTKEGSYKGNAPYSNSLAVLVVNLSTGSMFQMTEQVMASEALVESKKQGVEIYALRQIPDRWKPYLSPYK